MSTSAVNCRSYDRIADQWTAARDASFVSRLIIDFATKVCVRGRILDIGCGSGYVAAYLTAQGFQLTGVDSAKKMIARANTLSLAGADFRCMDFFDFVSPQKFDGLLAWDSFFHFPKARQADIYQKAAGLLHHAGYLLFTHGDADDEHVDQMMGESFYYSALPKQQVVQLLQAAGFSVVYAYTNFMEQGTDRRLVVLAQKVR